MSYPATFHGSMIEQDHIAQNTRLDQFEIAIASDTGTMKVGPGFWNGLTAIGSGPKVYRPLLTQTGTDAPVATVLENTLDSTVVWARSGTGTYTTQTGVFDLTKTFIVNQSGFLSVGDQWTFQISVTVAGAVTITAYADPTGSVTADDLLSNFPIEILVYP